VEPEYASLSPDAWKNDCPTAAMFVKILSVVVLGPPPQVHEQLKFLTVLLAVTMVFRTSFWLLPPSYTTTFASPGAMAIAISISNDTSSFAPEMPL
jgi:hypothetical protein